MEGIFSFIIIKGRVIVIFPLVPDHMAFGMVPIKTVPAGMLTLISLFTTTAVIFDKCIEIDVSISSVLFSLMF